MEKWRRVWREGFAPLLSQSQLIALHRALSLNDPRLLQGLTCQPTPLGARDHRAIEGACAISWCGWHGDDIRTVGELDTFFAHLCDAVDRAFHEPAACRYFLNWFDDTPRGLMRLQLLAEIDLALHRTLPFAA